MALRAHVASRGTVRHRGSEAETLGELSVCEETEIPAFAGMTGVFGDLGGLSPAVSFPRTRESTLMAVAAPRPRSHPSITRLPRGSARVLLVPARGGAGLGGRVRPVRRRCRGDCAGGPLHRLMAVPLPRCAGEDRQGGAMVLAAASSALNVDISCWRAAGISRRRRERAARELVEGAATGTTRDARIDSDPEAGEGAAAGDDSAGEGAVGVAAARSAGSALSPAARDGTLHPRFLLRHGAALRRGRRASSCRTGRA